jgi:hypothetical protein
VSEIFISYSRQDGKDVNLLARKLEDAGYKIWLDRSAIQGGARWQEEIVRGIEKANVFVIVLSPQSIASENVERELGLAHVTGKRILPVMLRRAAVPQPLRYALGSLEIIDISTDDIDTASQRVVQAIASPDARTGIVYLDGLWRDKLPFYLFFGYLGFLVFVLPFFEERWKMEWAVPIGFLILVAAILAVVVIRTFRRIHVDSCLNSRGTVLSTELKGFTKFRDRYRIASSWRDPETGNLYEFYSKKAPLDRLKFVDRTIPVIVNRRNFKIYRMDLPSLPKDASGSLAPSDSQEVENNTRKPSPAGKDIARDIFLSHSEQDREAVAPLLQKLESAGHAIWCVKAANGKDVSYEEERFDGISRAPLFLLVLTPDSIESTRVRGELDLAVAKGKRIITAVLRRTTVPQDLNYALASVPHVDLSEDFEIGVTGLLETIAAEPLRVTVMPESAAASRAAWLEPKLRVALQFALWIPVFIPLIGVLLVLKFISMVLPVRLHPSPLEARCSRLLELWDDILERSDLRWLRPRQRLDSRLYEFKDKARLLATEYETFEVKNDDRGRRLAIRILSQWRDPVSQQRYRFRSNWLACDPERIRTKIIPVYVDPANLRRYLVDLSFLPEDQRREVPKRALPKRRLRNGLFRVGTSIAEETSSAAPLLREQEELASSRVFVSHSNENEEKARLLIERLEGAGYEVVNRSETAENQTGEEKSESRISLAGTTLIIVPSAAASDLASKVLELRHAYTIHRRIIPVTFGDYEIPPSMQLSLSGVQCVDLSRDLESGIRVLLNALPSRKSGQAPAPDYPKKVSPSRFGGPVRRVISSVMMGAFSWALGLTLSIVSLDRRPAIPGLIHLTTTVALVYGSVIGAIFHRRRMKPYGLFLVAFVSLVLFPVAVALFIPDHTINSGSDTRTLMLTPVLGTLAFIGTKLIYVVVFNYRLKKRGTLILTEYKGSGMSQWRDPVTDKVHTFVRGYSGMLAKPIRSTTIAVFMDPTNPSDYYMDLSYRSRSKV